MSLIDRFRKKREDAGKDKKPVHISSTSEKEKKVEKKVEEKKSEQPLKTEKHTTKTKVLKQNTREAYRILKHVLQTEKMSRIGKYNQYAFAVPAQVSKVEIEQAVRALYGVKPIKISCVKVHGKVVRFGRTQGKQRSWKKALIKLKQGETIDTTD